MNTGSQDQDAPARRNGARLAAVATAGWALALAAGGVVFVHYQFTPGAEAQAPRAWPDDSSLARVPARPTLVLFAHPGCSCTRASLEELQVVMARVRTPFTAHVVFALLEGFDPAHASDGAWDLAGRIPGLERRADLGGREARRFGALVSGYALLYDAEGRLRFEGGITGSRGHVGANAGRSSLIALLRGDAADDERTPVFGCLLFDRASDGPPAARHAHGGEPT